MYCGQLFAGATSRFRNHQPKEPPVNYGQPKLDLDEICVLSKRTVTDGIQLNWENDREYCLYPKRPPTGDVMMDSLREWFRYLDIGGEYRFEIAFQSVPTRRLLQEKTLCLYVPPAIDFKPALTHVVKWLTNLWNKQRDKSLNRFSFTKKQVGQIVTYAMKDLLTGEVLRHNTEAGQDADAAIGIPLK